MTYHGLKVFRIRSYTDPNRLDDWGLCVDRFKVALHFKLGLSRSRILLLDGDRNGLRHLRGKSNVRNLILLRVLHDRCRVNPISRSQQFSSMIKEATDQQQSLEPYHPHHTQP